MSIGDGACPRSVRARYGDIPPRTLTTECPPGLDTVPPAIEITRLAAERDWVAGLLTELESSPAGWDKRRNQRLAGLSDITIR